MSDLVGNPEDRFSHVTAHIEDTSYMSRDARKPVFDFSDQLRHKVACTVTEAEILAISRRRIVLRLEILAISRRLIVLSE